MWCEAQSAAVRMRVTFIIKSRSCSASCSVSFVCAQVSFNPMTNPTLEMNPFDCDMPTLEVWPDDAGANNYEFCNTAWSPQCSLVPISMAQGVEREYLKEPPSPTHSLDVSEYECTSSTKSSYPSSPMFSRDSTPLKSSHSKTSSGGGRSSVLTEFRKHKESFDFSEIRGHLLEFSKDQHGSRFIQKQMETATEEEKQEVFSEMLASAALLMEDHFGNYVVQKFFEFGSHHQIQILCGLLRGNVVMLSLQTYGCRVMQKAIETLVEDDQVKLLEELDGHVIACAMDQNGNHVIQKCFDCVNPVHLDFIIEAFEGMMVPLATHPYGCRVVQRVLEHANATQCRRLLREVLSSTCHLVQDEFGNYVMQHVLEHGEMADRIGIIYKLRGQLTTLSQHKYASNVIEKCISRSPSKVLRHLVIEELFLQENAFLVLLKDQYGNYVMQKALDCADIDQHKSMVYKISPHLTSLRKYTYARQMVIKVEKILTRSGSFW